MNAHLLEDGPRDGRVGDTKPTKGYAQPGSARAGAQQPRTNTRNDEAVSCGALSPNGEVLAPVGPPSPRAHVRATRPPLSRPHSEASYLEPSSRANQMVTSHSADYKAAVLTSFQ